MSGPAKLKFSEKYNQDDIRQSFLNSHARLARRVSHLRDEHMVRKALKRAGEPGLVLDIPCGVGRFWPLLAEKKSRIIIGADQSADILSTACRLQNPDIVKRVKPLETSALNISLPDSSVDTIFSMRPLHQTDDAEQRMAVLTEFHRVTRETVILSQWIEGHYAAVSSKRQDAERETPDQQGDGQNRSVLHRSAAEAEFISAGFIIEKRIDLIPFCAMWRVYVLRKL
ncbi:class I SAM-dependent methyltransferase [Pseudomonas alliivorans]|nr:class I SAM-dependent methyltransferase [Pseudomonas alliivorans]MEE4679593.1 class I SAM-dependent methyltransferase [Pseudomonas alliivorans]MEE4689378.1 class I SAM-dependent methyltransferase [Pseudomonas alliivorans]MEE4698150.1 class I SAM-dependent methyltransferase [Pseudomonas alliivorans]MEE4698915.1 class I SAM-dependent methyltransferase [Pseudomonas alliivorans]